MQRRNYYSAAFPVVPERVTLEFGARHGHYSPERPHVGLDVAPWPGSFGEPVFAPVAGQVIAAGDSGGGKGNWAVIEERLAFDLVARDLAGSKRKVPAGARVAWVLAHLQGVEVAVGDRVQPGQRIGTVGSTGYSFGAHVHVELRAFGISPGGFVYLDPLDYLTKRVDGLLARLDWANA